MREAENDDTWIHVLAEYQRFARAREQPAKGPAAHIHPDTRALLTGWIQALFSPESSRPEMPALVRLPAARARKLADDVELLVRELVGPDVSSITSFAYGLALEMVTTPGCVKLSSEDEARLLDCLDLWNQSDATPGSVAPEWCPQKVAAFLEWFASLTATDRPQLARFLFRSPAISGRPGAEPGPPLDNYLASGLNTLGVSSEHLRALLHHLYVIADFDPVRTTTWLSTLDREHLVRHLGRELAGLPADETKQILRSVDHPPRATRALTAAGRVSGDEAASKLDAELRARRVSAGWEGTLARSSHPQDSQPIQVANFRSRARQKRLGVGILPRSFGAARLMAELEPLDEVVVTCGALSRRLGRPSLRFVVRRKELVTDEITPDPTGSILIDEGLGLELLETDGQHAP